MPSPDAAAGRRLRAFIEVRWDTSPDWTLRLAAALGVSKTALYGWLAGREPSLDSIGRLAAVLEVRRYEVLRAWDGD